MYLSTYINKDSKYSKESIVDEMQYLLSAGLEGIHRPLGHEIRRTELIQSYRTPNLQSLKSFLIRAKDTISELLKEENVSTVDELYTEFTIPKRNGGRRALVAPNEGLKLLQRELLHYLKIQYKALEHNAAHAYVTGRDTVTNASVHKNNYNFVNTDLSNFFPSIREENIIEAMMKNANLHTLTNKLHTDEWRTLMDIVLYKGALSQGSVISPYLSNIVLLSFDHEMTEYLKENYRNIIYTRYADDMTFSSKLKLKSETILEIINTVKEKAYDNPEFITVNPDKTRQSTYRGKNRVTGVKINAENNLSIGYKEKQQIKTDVFKLLLMKKNNEPIEVLHKQEVVGMFSYLNSVEPEYAKYLKRQWGNKLNIHMDVVSFLMQD